MTEKDKVFNELYSKLNTSQKKAVDTVEGPVMVIAGPGTGKTTLLTLRIANILRVTDATPSSILALTFTESGVRAMRQKLVSIIGADAYKVGIYTFHSFCNEIIKKYPEEFPHIIGSENISDVDRIALVESILDAEEFEYIRPYGDPYYYVYPLLSQIQDVKREGYAPEEYQDFLDQREKDFAQIPDLYHEKGRYKGQMKGEYRTQEKLLKKDKEFLVVFKKYQEKLREQKKIDFEDMIVEVVKVLESNKDFLLTLQEEYQYILADEHQDANRAQNTILELLSNFHESPNLFVVGDEKQAIFRFQGASLQNFLYFSDLYKDTVVIRLEENYRSTQSILDNAYELIKNNNVEASLQVELKSKTKEENAPIKVYSYAKQYDEIHFILHDIKEKIAAGVDPNEIAIIYRNNKDSFDLLRHLERTDIPFTLFSDQNILDHVDIRRLLMLFQAIMTISDDAHIAEAMHISYFNIPAVDVYTIVEHARKTKQKIFDVIMRDLPKLRLKDTYSVEHFGSLLETWSTSARNNDALHLTEQVIHESGYVQDILKKPAPYERLQILDTFFSEMKRVVAHHAHFTLADFMEHVSILKKYDISIKAKNQTSRNGVKLMTAHRSKGLEYEYVYIFDAIQKKWGQSKNRVYFTPPVTGLETNSEDERRLFYVALTRAKKEVIITYAEYKDDGTEALPTQFIEELRAECVEHIVGESVDIRDVYTTPLPKKSDPSLHDIEYLRNRFLQQPFSVTALNNYLECPWRYFYTNLIRLPQTYSKQQTYGTVAHDALRDLFVAVAANPETVNREMFMKSFYAHLEEHPLDEKTRDELRQKGEVSLGGYFDFYYETFVAPVETEFKLFTDFSIDSNTIISLTGTLDKLEGPEDALTVVDYKTSKIKTRNDILGKTKSSTGSIFRQLSFYKLLLEDTDTPYCMKKGRIDFLEPNDSGRYLFEEFEITTDDTDLLRDEIKKASQEILSLSFWNTTCEDPKCEFCALRKITE